MNQRGEIRGWWSNKVPRTLLTALKAVIVFWSNKNLHKLRLTPGILPTLSILFGDVQREAKLYFLIAQNCFFSCWCESEHKKFAERNNFLIKLPVKKNQLGEFLFSVSLQQNHLFAVKWNEKFQNDLNMGKYCDRRRRRWLHASPKINFCHRVWLNSERFFDQFNIKKFFFKIASRQNLNAHWLQLYL